MVMPPGRKRTPLELHEWTWEQVAIDRPGPLYRGTPCWLWLGATAYKGYGQADPPGPEVRTRAHRWVWSLVMGAIPPGMELDHLCRRPGCVRPSYLEPVSPDENRRRAIVARGQTLRGGGKYERGPCQYMGCTDRRGPNSRWYCERHGWPRHVPMVPWRPGAAHACNCPRSRRGVHTHVA